MSIIKTISKINKKITGIEALGLMIKNSKSYKNAPRDLSTNDEYLYGINSKL